MRQWAVLFCMAASIVCLPTLAVATEYKAGSVSIINPYSRATPSGAMTGAGYMNIKNTGEEDDRLISASCGCASKAEVHEMSNNNNVMSMRHMTEGLIIPAGGEVTLKPGGYHIMFMGLKKSFVADDIVKATLTFEKAGEVIISLKVMSLRGGKKKMHDSHSKH
jgi:hypothetical protein